ncbi:CDP-diacylglycerol--glycerol-3-phosphate 3-phosphatidyltransferase [Candidatus Saccharibacteria bacterium]|nr:CDP-diacylglycerol--glycerol-3-phosphate 3-phosphatidyltransferase [Candidatus Saccharibacteria bacterium]
MKKNKNLLNGPTILTIARIFLVLPFMILLFQESNVAKIIAFILFVIASLTDLVDGKWARRKKIVTDFGAFLDPLADKMLVNLAFLALVYLNVVPLFVFALILIRDFAVDGMRMTAARSGITISASIFGKLKTTFQMIALSILILNLSLNFEPFLILGNIILYIAFFLTLFSGADYLIKGSKLIVK